MKAQLKFFAEVLGCPTKALYWMHGVNGCYHGFAELSESSYIAFVQHPENAEEIEGDLDFEDDGYLDSGVKKMHIVCLVD